MALFGNWGRGDDDQVDEEQVEENDERTWEENFYSFFSENFCNKKYFQNG